MRLTELRKKAERDYEIDLVHQNPLTQVVTVLMDKSIGDHVFVVVQYAYDSFSQKWEIAKSFSTDDCIVAVNEFNSCLNNETVDPLDGLKFNCPNCRSHTLESCQDGYHKSRVACIDWEGDHEYGQLESEGDVVRWQCESCGYVLKNEHGDITDNVEVAQWVKDNCK